MIVVCGATGRIGGTAARALRARGLAVKAVVRDAAKSAPLVEQGCTLAVADLADASSLTKAFRDATAVLVICPVPPSEVVVEKARRVIDGVGAALEAVAPAVVVAISDYGAHVPDGTGITLILRSLDGRLRGLRAATTFLRSAEHMQNWLRQLAVVRATGMLPSLHHPITRPFPTVSAFDVGRVAAEILAAPAAALAGPRTIHVEGPRRYAAADVAAVFARRLGRDVTAHAVDRAEWAAALAKAGIGGSFARLVIELQDAHNRGLVEIEPGGTVHRASTELADALGG
jgi:NAD(P)H dehydrogenase (quinone)